VKGTDIFCHSADDPSGPGSPNYRGLAITDTPHSVRFLYTGDQLDAETSTGRHTTLTGRQSGGKIPSVDLSFSSR